MSNVCKGQKTFHTICECVFDDHTHTLDPYRHQKCGIWPRRFIRLNLNVKNKRVRRIGRKHSVNGHRLTRTELRTWPEIKSRDLLLLWNVYLFSHLFFRCHRWQSQSVCRDRNRVFTWRVLENQFAGHYRCEKIAKPWKRSEKCKQNHFVTSLPALASDVSHVWNISIEHFVRFYANSQVEYIEYWKRCSSPFSNSQ